MKLIKTCGWGLVACCALLSASALAAPAPVNSPYGSWRLVGASVNVPPACRQSRLEIGQDQVRVISGKPEAPQFSFHSQMAMSHNGNIYVMHLRKPVHNSQPDCQGHAAGDIVKHFNTTRYLQVSGDSLFHYLGPDSSGGYLRYQRVASSARGVSAQ
ncbi:hypothetical protein ACFOSS_12785 [Pseudaeromonas sharmana]|uniref:Uncharacterized protein n=1 Tax=Pseudaeromonas sharmana TaxID=328412 RepID=A0ABV8CQP9_9GAMM